jgi:serine protease Do
MPTDLEVLRDLEQTTMAVLEKARPAFVFIAGGSGFLISEDGYVLTNEHVVAGARQVRVLLSGGRMYRADVVGHDPEGDVALLKLQSAGGLPYLELGDSSALRVGQRVIALGDPFLLGSQNLFLDEVPLDYEPAASLGIISALNRYSDTYNDAIQVDLAVNGGNSGGPLLTLEGKVVGINGKIETRFNLRINTGVGYAIPSNQIRRFLEPLKAAAGGVVLHGTIRGLHVGARAGDKPGLPVTRVVEGSPAAEAGFRPEDLILALDGLPVRTQSRFRGILGTYPAGERITAKVQRGGEVLEISTVLVGAGRAFAGLRTQLAGDGQSGAEVAAVVPASPAQRAGFREGDVITSFGGEPVASPTDLAQLIQKRQVGERVKVMVLRDGETMELELQLTGRLE